LLLGLILNAFFGLKKTPALMSVQPIGALLFAVYSVVWVFGGTPWEEKESNRGIVSDGVG
jgi:hypothetical protein